MYHSMITGAAQAAVISASILSTAVAGVAAGFLETDLVANQSLLTDANGVKHTPALVDMHLVNPWGVGSTPTSQFWVSDNGKGLSTTYVTPVPPPPSPPPPIKLGTRVVSIPTPSDPLGSSGTPTGLVFNIAQAAGAFKISNGTATAPAAFLFATEDGTILGWSPTVDPTHAIIAVPKSVSRQQ
jgi:uncharacterized protein (TIGR03118 family)